ncbi:MAG TPA: YbdK family carboxylate-amine ligase [Gaiellaceae bacterium]|jgi:carboxylate-amine ligase|nr:YbdK family carboxylate-amine ligase [Gaiellaceae bacterium]
MSILSPVELANGGEALAASYQGGFSGSDLLTLGLEEELILVDPVSLEPAEEIELLLGAVSGTRFEAELRTSQVELVMPVSLSAADLAHELALARATLVEGLDGRVRLLAAGTHPVATGAVRITDRPRYRRIASEYGWVTRRGMPSGLHVHVGIGDADEAIAIYNAARGYLPELAALGANSPFFEAGDSSLASSRLKLVEDLPRAGIPPSFASWRELAGFVSWGAAAKLFPDLTYLWWDLRPRPDLGTIEFRVADAQTPVEHTAALVAICQSLVASLRLRYRESGQLPTHPTHVIAENRWRAVRDGLEGELVDPLTGEPEPARARIAGMLRELEPFAAELGCAAELECAWPMLVRNGANRQREIAAGRGLPGLLAWLVDETERSSL